MSEQVKEMTAMQRIGNIFMAPEKAMASIVEKPTWLIPYLICVIITVALQFTVLDIGIKDQIAIMEAKDAPAERIEMVETQMQGPMRFISIPMIPIGTLAIWAFFAGVLILGGNTIMGGDGKFKQYFSIVAWTGLVTLVGGILKTLLILAKGTSYGVTTSLAMIMPTPELGDSGSLIYKILSKFDLFTIWQLALWIIGISVLNKISKQKSATLVVSLWILWIVVSIAIGSAFQGRFN